MSNQLALSLSRGCFKLSLVLLTVCFQADLVRAQTGNPLPSGASLAADLLPGPRLTQSLTRPDAPPPIIIPPPLPEFPSLPRPRISPPLPPPSNFLQPLTPPPPASEISPGTIPGTITIKEFRFIGNTAFSSKSLSKLLSGFTKGPITFADLLKARTAVSQLYQSQGYITSGAYLPQQSLARGIVFIRVVEAGLEKIHVTGTRRLNPNYVLERLEIATSKPLNRKRLLEALQLLRLNPLIKSISAELAGGSRPGRTVLEVRVTEAKSFIPQLILDNNRPPSLGTFDRGLQLNEADLLGLGDGLSAGYSNTDGSNNVNASYSLPLNPHNTTLNLLYGATWSHVIQPSFKQLDINANYRYYDFTLRQPLLQTPSKEFALGLTGSRRESDTTFLGSHFYGRLISPGADNQGRTRISALRFFQEFTKRNAEEVLAFRSQLNLGVGALNATIHRTGPDGRFFSWEGQGQWVRLLAPDTLLVVRGDLHLASRPLVPLEQFGLGGVETVRGYPAYYVLTDNAVFGSIELRLPVWSAPKEGTLLQLVPFVDVGDGWNNLATRSREQSSTSNNPNTLLSVGLSLRLQVGNNFTARFDWGQPLINDSFRKRTWQDHGFYFSVQFNPF